MKKIVYLFLAISFVFTSCEPMEDIHEEIRNESEGGVEGNMAYTLTEEDYDALELSFGNFSSLEDAETMIPEILYANFPAWGEGSLVDVTFNLYDPIVVEDYLVTPADYEAIELTTNYFSSNSEIQDFLEFQYPTAEEGEYVSLTYQTLADEILYTITADDFDFIGEEFQDTYPTPASSAANYSNFERRPENAAYWTDEMILEAIDEVLSENFEDVEGQRYNVSYAIYDGSAGTENMTVEFNGTEYVAVGGTSYEVTDADFDLIGAEFADEYPTPASSAANYGNFDRRPANAAYWSDSMIEEALNYLLMSTFPDATEGDEFEVTYAVYTGSSGEEVMSLILNNGEFVINENASVSTIEATTVFAYTNGTWNMPYTLENQDYAEMGQSYPNFDDEDEAIYKIAIFLESLYPYAEPGEMAAVSYQFYAGSTSTEYANFVFENDSWNHIPSVIETTLQFGYGAEGWEPDNTIVYTMTDADFALIGDALIEEYPEPADSAGYYGNFDRRPGNDAYWSNEMILEAIKILLNNIDPNAEEGQPYVVNYAIYDGSAGVESMSVIKQGGEWVLNGEVEE